MEGVQGAGLGAGGFPAAGARLAAILTVSFIAEMSLGLVSSAVQSFFLLCPSEFEGHLVPVPCQLLCGQGLAPHSYLVVVEPTVQDGLCWHSMPVSVCFSVCKNPTFIPHVKHET